MALESQTRNQNDNEEEDVGCFFLQPSTSPYNITQRVQDANLSLFNSTPQAIRSTKVKFRDELVSFEPDLTDDDVNSIESDQVDDDLPINQNMGMEERHNEEDIHPYNTVLNDSIDIYDIEEELDDAILEELVQSDEEEGDEYIEKTKCIPKQQAVNQNINALTANNSKPVKEHRNKPVRTKKSTKRRKVFNRTSQREEVHCKEHCIERIDTQLSISIKKLEIHEKPLVNLPPLQLHQRKCCDDIKLSSTERNLPRYNGYRSEYGLTSRQIKNRDRYVEMMRQKQMSRQKLIEEYRALKVQQNEKVFCQWLREVSNRNKEQPLRNQNPKGDSKSVSPSYLSPSTLIVGKMGKTKVRPKTAEFVPKINIKKTNRPHTTQSCVYIEVSPNILNQGIHIGDLLITNSKQLNKKLHILAVS